MKRERKWAHEKIVVQFLVVILSIHLTYIFITMANVIYFFIGHILLWIFIVPMMIVYTSHSSSSKQSIHVQYSTLCSVHCIHQRRIHYYFKLILIFTAFMFALIIFFFTSKHYRFESGVHRTTIHKHLHKWQNSLVWRCCARRVQSSIIKLYEEKKEVDRCVHGVNEILEDRMRKELGNRLQCAHQMFMKIKFKNVMWYYYLECMLVCSLYQFQEKK